MAFFYVLHNSVERRILQWWFGFYGGSQSGIDEAAASRENHSPFSHSILQETGAR